MSNSRRDFLKLIGGESAIGLGGTSLPACTTTSHDPVSLSEQSWPTNEWSLSHNDENMK